LIVDQITADGEVIVLIGTRLGESQQRTKSIKKHDIKGHGLLRHC